MSEAGEAPQSEGLFVDRELKSDEIRDAIDLYRKRLIKALRAHKDARIILSKKVWNLPLGTQSVSWPEDQPEWEHVFSRVSVPKSVIKSQPKTPESGFLMEEGLDLDDSLDDPRIEFTRTIYKERQTKLTNRTTTLVEANAFVNRIEAQLGRPAVK